MTVLPALLPRWQRPAALLAALLSLLPTLYQLRYFEELVYRAVIPEPWDAGMSLTLIFLVLGAVYRLLGPVMPVLVLFFFSYNLHAQLFPGAFRGTPSPSTSSWARPSTRRRRASTASSPGFPSSTWSTSPSSPG